MTTWNVPEDTPAEVLTIVRALYDRGIGVASFARMGPNYTFVLLLPGVEAPYLITVATPIEVEGGPVLQ